MPKNQTKFHISEASHSFWGHYTKLVRSVVIPYQWEALNDRIEGAEPSHAVRNFRIAAGLESGTFAGFVFQDSDLGKWIEAVAFSLETQPDAALEAVVDELVELIGQAQHADGYINTFFTLEAPGLRWTNLWECHELYTAGHLLEGAVAYFQATGKRRFLDIMIRFAELIYRDFGRQPGQIRGYDGHEEIELALLRLHDVTGDSRWAELSAFFLEERGQEPSFILRQWEELGKISHWTKSVAPKPDLKYFQAHQPVRQQTMATGHAVRAVYLYTAMAGLAGRTGDRDLLASCLTLWNNVVHRQMYITGGIGSTNHGEAFSTDHDLPNDTIYAETCASIGLIFFAEELLATQPKAEFADVIERALYNTVLAAMALDGRHFFYVNPLEVWPEACARNPAKHHVKPVRQSWFGCACCPPNIARLVASLGHRVFGYLGSTLYVHQYINGQGEMELPGGKLVVSLETAYPWQGRIALRVISAPEIAHQATGAVIAIRIPGWCTAWQATVCGLPLSQATAGDGYLHLTGPWQAGDEIILELAMEARVYQANPLVRADAGQVCLQRGPIVYCFEECDNGANLSALSIDPAAPIREIVDKGLPPGTVCLEMPGMRLPQEGWDGQLYRAFLPQSQAIQMKAIPYFLWANRQPGEMRVWLRAALSSQALQ